MPNFKAKNRQEAGKELTLVNQQLSSLVRSLDPVEFVPLLLSIEDAINNLEIMCMKAMMIEGSLMNLKVLAASQFITEWYVMINDALLEISDSSHISSVGKLAQLPEFSVGICFTDDLEKELRLLRKKGQLGVNDTIFRKPRIFLNKYHGWFYLAAKGKIDRLTIRKLSIFFNLRDLFFKKGLLETMIYAAPKGTELEFNDEGLRKIVLPDGVTAESVFEKDGMTPRLIETYTSVSDWNSLFQEIGYENLKHVEQGRSLANLNGLKQEDKEIYDAYASIKNYPEVFEKFYGIEFKSFFKIVSEITYLCYNKANTLGQWKLSDLFLKDTLKAFGSAKILQVLDLLSEKSKRKKRFSGFFTLGEVILTSFRRLTASRLILMEKCFAEVLNNDLKGRAFEEACRTMLCRKGFNTLPGRVNIPEPVLPPNVSFTLWGKQKQRTDFDVISSQGNCLMIIECKEIKSHLLRPRIIGYFHNYLVEHFFKTKWIVNDIGKFERYAGGNLHDLLSVDKTQPIYLFPILVTNILVELKDMKRIPLVTYLELKEIASEKNLLKQTGSGMSGAIELEIKGHRISLPWLCAKVRAE